MVALFRLFHHGLVGLQRLLGLKSGAVNALQASLGLVAAPVGGRRTGQGESRDVLGGRYVRAAAEIEPLYFPGARVDVVIVGEIAGTDFCGLVGVRVNVALVLDQLELEGLLGEGLFRFLSRFVDVALEALAALDDLLHALFNRLEIFRRERLGGLEIEVETILNGRADAQLGAGEFGLHGLGHNVAAGVADDGAAVFLAGGNRGKGGLRVWGVRQIKESAVLTANDYDSLRALIRKVELSHCCAHGLAGGHGEGIVIDRYCGDEFRHNRAPLCARASAAYLAASAI